jgi:voltage-gated potassium channel
MASWVGPNREQGRFDIASLDSTDVQTVANMESRPGVPVGFGSRVRRGALTGFVTKHRVAWEVVMAALTATYVALSFFEDTTTTLAITPYTALLFALSAVFLGEFTARFWDAPDRRTYLRGHWIDLLTSFPLIGPLRALRMLRLLRFMRLGLAVRSLVLGSRVDNSWLIGPFLLFFWFASAYALWLAEHSVNPAITTFSSALLYAFLTACTVGYGSFTPVTIEGKLISGLIVFVAIGLVGFTSARLTAMYLNQKDEQLAPQLALIERDITEIKNLVALLAANEQPKLERLE